MQLDTLIVFMSQHCFKHLVKNTQSSKQSPDVRIWTPPSHHGRRQSTQRSCNLLQIIQASKAEIGIGVRHAAASRYSLVGTFYMVSSKQCPTLLKIVNKSKEYVSVRSVNEI